MVANKSKQHKKALVEALTKTLGIVTEASRLLTGCNLFQFLQTFVKAKFGFSFVRTPGSGAGNCIVQAKGFYTVKRSGECTAGKPVQSVG